MEAGALCREEYSRFPMRCAHPICVRARVHVHVHAFGVCVCVCVCVCVSGVQDDGSLWQRADDVFRVPQNRVRAVQRQHRYDADCDSICGPEFKGEERTLMVGMECAEQG